MKFTSNRDISIGIEDMEKAAQFYESVLGFKPEKTQTNLRVYNTGHITLYIEQRKAHPPILNYAVENLQDAVKHLLENECTVIVQREKSLYFEDPFGLVWDLVEQ